MEGPRERAELDLVRQTARLARLDLAPEQVAAMSEQFGRILAAFETLAEVDVEGVEPLLGPGGLHDVLRDDRVRPSLPRDELLARAPDAVDGFFSVPKTIPAPQAEAGSDRP